jgi:hypothetical protein
MLSVMTVTGRLHFEELQHRCHVSGTYANLYVKWGKFKCVLTEITAFLLCYSLRKKIVGHYFPGNLCTYTCQKCFNLIGPPSDTFYKDYNS